MAIIQVRGVPADVQRRLQAHAAAEGKSLSEYLRAELEQLASLPTLSEMVARVAARQAGGGQPAERLLKAERRRRGL